MTHPRGGQESLAEPSPESDDRDRLTGAPSAGEAQHARRDERRDEQRADATGRPRWTAPLIASVLAVGTGVLAVLLRSTIHPGDARSYLVKNAVNFPESTWNAAGFSRYGITLPLLPFERLWGVSQASEYALPVLGAAWLAVVVYLIGRRMWNDVAGVAAAVLVVLDPVYFITTTRIYPDSLSAPILATAFLLILVVGDRVRAVGAVGAVGAGGAGRDAADVGDLGDAGDGAGGGPSRRGRVTLLLVAIGFLVGWSWAVREISVVVWPVLVWMLLRRVRLRRALLPVALPALGWLVLELVLNQIGHHDPFARFKILTGSYASGVGPPKGVNFEHHTRRTYLMYLPHTWRERPELTWLLVVAAVALVGAVLFFRTMAYLTAWTALTLGLQLAEGGVLNPTSVSLRLDIERYWISFLLPMTLLAVGTVAEVLRRLARRRGERARPTTAEPTVRRGGARGVLVSVAVFAVLLAVPVHAFAGWSQREWQLEPRGEAGLEELRTYLTSHVGPDDRIWATPYQLKMLRFYQPGPFGGHHQWSAQLEELPRSGDTAPAPGDLVLRIPRSGCTLCNEGLNRWKPGASARTAGWTPVWTSADGGIRLYQDR